MKRSIHQFDAAKRWNRATLNVFWWSIGLSTLAEIYVWQFATLQDPIVFLKMYILRPFFGSVAVVLATEFFVKRISERSAPYLIVTTASLLCAILVAVHNGVATIFMLFLLPLFVSVFYFDKAVVVYTGGINILLFICIGLWVPNISAMLSGSEWVTAVTSMVGGTMIILLIINRGIALLHTLEEETEAKQQLLVQRAWIEKLSKTDALTGLYNHRTFHEYLDHLLDLRGENEIQMSLAILDIDNFKQVNDRYGHRIGDLIIQRVAHTVREGLTVDDIVARYGGEELAVIFTGKTLDQAAAAIEQIRTSLLAVRHAELDDSPVTVSVGVASYENGDTKEQWFEKADRLLYKAKKNGKNRTETC